MGLSLEDYAVFISQAENGEHIDVYDKNLVKIAYTVPEELKEITFSDGRGVSFGDYGVIFPEGEKKMYIFKLEERT